MLSSRDKLGLGILIGLFVLCAVLLIFLMKGKSSGKSRPFSDSAIVRQRVINQQK